MRRTSAPQWITTLVVVSLVATASASATAANASVANARFARAHAATNHVRRLLADVSGKWAMTVSGPQGATESSVVFKQEADTILSGTVESQMFGMAKLAGAVKGDTVRFAFTVDIQGMQFELRAGGMVKDKDNISGQLEAPNGMGSFPFTMKRVP